MTITEKQAWFIACREAKPGFNVYEAMDRLQNDLLFGQTLS
jgi:hypothetical protein